MPPQLQPLPPRHSLQPPSLHPPSLQPPSLHHPARRPAPSPWTSSQRLWSGLSSFSKRSYRSFATSSFEADDERSSASGSSGRDNMSSRGSGDLSRPAGQADLLRYRNQDTRPTSAKELLGWYAYAFAAEVYIICGISSFIPILLETLARQNGVLSSDRSQACGSSDDAEGAGSGQCIITLFGLDIDTGSFTMYTFSVSVLIQAFLVVSISGAADHGNYRKKLLLAFGWLGSLSVMAYILVGRSTYVLGALLAIVSNASFGASFVLLNSFLPLLVRYHPDVLASGATATVAGPEQLRRLGGSHSESDEAEAPMVTSPPVWPESGDGQQKLTTTDKSASLELQLSTQISSKGIGIGYSAGVFMQCVAIGILIAGRDPVLSQRIALLVIGAWWAVFTVPAALFLRPRPGPPLAVTEASGAKGARAWISYTAHAWRSLFATIRLARRLRDVMLFLASWFLLSDAIATTSSTAILFAKNELHMKPWSLGMINVISTVGGVVGAFGWSFISRALRLKPHQTILACIGLFSLIPLYGLTGYIPAVRASGMFGLQQAWEMYPLGALYGFVLGGIGSYCRSLYGELIPPGSEAAFYALYAITDKGSSVFGPAIVGAIIQRSGAIRPAFWFLLLMVSLPAPMIYIVDVERGRREGEKLAAAATTKRRGWQRDGDEDSDGEEGRDILAAFEAETEAS